MLFDGSLFNGETRPHISAYTFKRFMDGLWVDPDGFVRVIPKDETHRHVARHILKAEYPDWAWADDIKQGGDENDALLLKGWVKVSGMASYHAHRLTPSTSAIVVALLDKLLADHPQASVVLDIGCGTGGENPATRSELASDLRVALLVG